MFLENGEPAPVRVNLLRFRENLRHDSPLCSSGVADRPQLYPRSRGLLSRGLAASFEGKKHTSAQIGVPSAKMRKSQTEKRPNEAFIFGGPMSMYFSADQSTSEAGKNSTLYYSPRRFSQRGRMMPIATAHQNQILRMRCHIVAA